MRISSTYFSDTFLSQINSLQTQENTLQDESSSGLKVTLPEDNPGVMSDVLNQQTAAAASTQYQSNITSLQSAATTSGSAMTNLQTITSRIDQIATLASNGTATAQLPGYASEVNSLIQQAVQLGNTQDANGNYIFSGTATQTKPFTATTDANGNVTAVSYAGNSATAQSAISSSATVSAQVPGENNTGSGAPGLFADSRSGTDLFSHMIALQQDLASGNVSAITSTDAPALTKDDNNIISHISANGVMQASLTSANDIATSQQTTIATQISGETNADLAQTLTKLDQTQTAYQAALESGTKIMSLSLLDYLQ